MKVLVIGSGGREHAICWKLRQSSNISQVYCAPGNPGIGMTARCVDIKVDDLNGLLTFAKDNQIALTVVGPEFPLTLGIVDLFRKEGLRIFGASKAAAELEGSKSFAKKIMNAANVPTARYQVVHTKDEAEKYVAEYGAPVVLKADGLASGKGVFVCATIEEAHKAITSLFSKSGSHRVVVEEFLEGVEVSYIIATDGEHIIPLAPSHDYKRIFDKDQGPNTGGMGSVCPTPRFTAEDEDRVIYEVMVPVISEMKRRGTPFSGFLYAGLMKSRDGRINVLEFNTRLGDPETQSIMRRMKSDLFEVLYKLSEPRSEDSALDEDLVELEWSNDVAVCLVIASEGYPDTPKLGDEITGLHLTEILPDVVVFHAGTGLSEDKIVTTGGRVLGVTATGSNIESARSSAYKAADLIQFRGRHLRRDIGI